LFTNFTLIWCYKGSCGLATFKQMIAHCRTMQCPWWVTWGVAIVLGVRPSSSWWVRRSECCGTIALGFYGFRRQMHAVALGVFRILKRPNHLEMVGPFQDPENAHGPSRDRPKSWKRAQHGHRYCKEKIGQDSQIKYPVPTYNLYQRVVLSIYCRNNIGSPVNDDRVSEKNYNLYTIIFNVNNGSKQTLQILGMGLSLNSLTG